MSCHVKKKKDRASGEGEEVGVRQKRVEGKPQEQRRRRVVKWRRRRRGVQMLKQEGKDDGFEKQETQRRRNRCTRETQTCETKEKVEQEVSRGEVLTDEGGVEGERWEKSDGSEGDNTR